VSVTVDVMVGAFVVRATTTVVVVDEDDEPPHPAAASEIGSRTATKAQRTTADGSGGRELAGPLCGTDFRR
jgi:hypothetical protein